MRPGSLEPSFFLETGCLMKARSFSSMLKNMEMALRIYLLHFRFLWSVNCQVRELTHKFCFNLNDVATHNSVAPFIRRNWFCTLANFEAFEAASMLLKVLNILTKLKTSINAKRLTWTWWWCSDLVHLFLCQWPASPLPWRLQWCQPATNALNTRKSILDSMSNEHNTHLGHKRVSEGRLAVVDMCDHGHVPDVLLLVHAFPHLVSCEVNLQFNLDDKQ